jgi:hypothetical protein
MVEKLGKRLWLWCDHRHNLLAAVVAAVRDHLERVGFQSCLCLLRDVRQVGRIVEASGWRNDPTRIVIYGQMKGRFKESALVHEDVASHGGVRHGGRDAAALDRFLFLDAA